MMKKGICDYLAPGLIIMHVQLAPFFWPLKLNDQDSVRDGSCLIQTIRSDVSKEIRQHLTDQDSDCSIPLT